MRSVYKINVIELCADIFVYLSKISQNHRCNANVTRKLIVEDFIIHVVSYMLYQSQCVNTELFTHLSFVHWQVNKYFRRFIS